jgi:uncharacterized membrane protein
MLVVLPLRLCVFSLLCDLLYLGGAEAGIWFPLALYSMVGGFVAVLATVLPGVVASMNRQVNKVGLTNLNAGLIVVSLYAVNIWLRLGEPANMAIAIVLSAIGVGVLAVSSRLGGETVHVQGVAVVTQPGARPPADRE